MQLIEICRAAGHEVRVSSSCQDSTYRTQLERLGITTTCHVPNDSAFDQYLREYLPDIVFFDRFIIEEQFGWRVKNVLPDALRILDTIDLHALRRLRQAKVERGEDPKTLSSLDVTTDDFVREVAALYRSDLNLLTSDKEERFLKETFNLPPYLLELFRFSYAPPEPPLPYAARSHFVSIGNFNHAPNTDSFRLLCQEIWPRILSRFKAAGLAPPELHIYGAYPTQEFLKLPKLNSGVRVFGWTENVLKTLQQYRVNLAPLRFGAGIKGKIADGWVAGTPCVTTWIGAEGMTTLPSGQDLEFGGFVADTWDEFADRAIQLYCNTDVWDHAQSAGRSIISELFSHEKQARRFLETLQTAMANRDSHRSSNFIGTMLWYHLHRSTEFMSRWIEAKNKLSLQLASPQ